MLWIGLDEAGYGPPLGPLVIGATVWRVPDELILGDKGADDRRIDEPTGDLYVLSDGIVHSTATLVKQSNQRKSDKAKATAKANRVTSPLNECEATAATLEQTRTRPVWITDSKAVHTLGGIAELERAALALFLTAQIDEFDSQYAGDLAAILSDEFSSREILNRFCLAGNDNETARDCLWAWCSKLAIPHFAETADIVDPAWFAQQLGTSEIQLLRTKTRIVFPGEFNALLDRYENKSNVLFHATMQLLQACLAGFDGEAAWIDADKQGGRDYYAAMLQGHFNLDWIDIINESNDCSVYSWNGGRVGNGDGETPNSTAAARRWIRFRVNGERSLPTAAASCIAKYVRELSMKSWNNFWSERVENLKPTAGYYNDAQRYIEQIKSCVKKLKIADHQIVRRK